MELNRRRRGAWAVLVTMPLVAAGSAKSASWDIAAGADRGMSSALFSCGSATLQPEAPPHGAGRGSAFCVAALAGPDPHRQHALTPADVGHPPGGMEGAAPTDAAPGRPARAEDPDPVGELRRGVLGSKHDFSAITGSAVDACSACHVPHLQAIRPREGDGSGAALELFRIAGQREVLVPGRYMPGTSSLICLSCHNGTIAASTIGTSHALMDGNAETLGGLGGFTARDHPVGVEYPEGGKGYHPRARVLAGGRVRLPEGRIECISCHDPHNAAGVEKMLAMPNRRSALCLTCHQK
ncbi:MAG: cytochrome c3 family protein [Planctomycetes bacterium]|nr:cytochrome c3 family protein [Planctomycetota bacterium]